MKSTKIVDMDITNWSYSQKEDKVFSLLNRARREFLRISWEDIYSYILNSNSSRDKGIILNYFKSKTMGYNGYGRLQRAFSI